METQALSIAKTQSKSFSKFIRLLIWKFQPYQLFCFAQNNVFKEENGCFATKNITADSRYCLLMVTAAAEPTEQTVQKFIDSRFAAGKITILCYSKKAALEAIAARNRFFLTIYSRSQLLYSKDHFQQANYNYELNPFKVLKNAERKSAHCNSLIDTFFAGAEYSLQHQEYPMCIMMLHQVTEQCLILLLNLHLSFKIEAPHSLNTLMGLCRSFSGQPQKLLLSSKEDKRLFEILVRSNSAIYHNLSFSVDENDARQLFIRISTFLKLTRLMCRNKIQQLEQEVTLAQTETHA